MLQLLHILCRIRSFSIIFSLFFPLYTVRQKEVSFLVLICLDLKFYSSLRKYVLYDTRTVRYILYTCHIRVRLNSTRILLSFLHYSSIFSLKQRYFEVFSVIGNPPVTKRSYTNYFAYVKRFVKERLITSASYWHITGIRYA